MSNKGKGWHGERARHREAALSARRGRAGIVAVKDTRIFKKLPTKYMDYDNDLSPLRKKYRQISKLVEKYNGEISETEYNDNSITIYADFFNDDNGQQFKAAAKNIAWTIEKDTRSLAGFQSYRVIITD